MTSPTVTLDATRPVAHVRLVGAGPGHLLDLATAQELARHVTHIAAAKQCRAVLLSSAGPFFCLGGDLHYIGGVPAEAGERTAQLAAALHEAVRTIAALDVPVVAAVQGAVAGGGLSLISACDLVVAAHDASFTVAYTKVGLSPDLGLSWFLPRLVGLRRAQEWILTNRTIEAAEALAAGLVSRLVPHHLLEAESLALAAQLAQDSPHAQAAVKQLLRESATSDFSSHLDLEAERVAALAATPEAHEAISRFLAPAAPSDPACPDGVGERAPLSPP